MEITDLNSQPIGKVCLTPQGTYNGANNYSKLDVVNYYGTSYIALKDVPVGCPPSFNGNNEYWNLIACGAAGTPYVDDSGVYTYTQSSGFTLQGVGSVAGIQPEGLDIPVTTLVTVLGDRIYEEIRSKIFNACYPTGSIYITTQSDGAAEILGDGAWERIQDRFIYGTSGNSGTLGGSSKINLTDVNAYAQIGFVDDSVAQSSEYQCNSQALYLTRKTTAIGSSAEGNFLAFNAFSVGNNSDNRQFNLTYARTGDAANSLGSKVAGVNGVALGGELDNMPPYFSTYVWLRITDPSKFSSNTQYESNALVYSESSFYRSKVASNSNDVTDTNTWENVTNIISYIIDEG